MSPDTRTNLRSECKFSHHAEGEVDPRLSLACSVLDALPEQIAVLDMSGEIVAVNAAWRRCGLQQGRPAGRSDIGRNYLEVCRNGGSAGIEGAGAAAVGIGEVLAGRTGYF